MIVDDPEFLKELLEIFKVESADYVQRISSGLLKLEANPPEEDSAAIIEEIFRDAHSLKGAARAVDIGSIEKVCQSMESIFHDLKKEPRPLPAHAFDTLQKAVDYIEVLLSNPDDPDGLVNEIVQKIENIWEEKIQEPEAAFPTPVMKEEKINVAEAEPPLENTGGEISPPPTPKQPEKPKAQPTGEKKITPSAGLRTGPTQESQTLRISGEKLDNLLRQAEELLSVKLQFYNNANQIKKLMVDFQLFRRDLQRQFDFLKSAFKKQQRMGGESFSDALVELYEKQTRDFADKTERFYRELSVMTNKFHHSTHTLDLMVENLLEDAKLAIMQPFSTLFDRIPRAARELERQLGKKAKLEIRGGEIEIDKRILEALWEPLIHIIRNALDHGIEAPEIREKFGKKPEGKLTLEVSQSEGNNVLLTISDDGAGLHYEKIRNKAVQLNLMSKEEASKASEEQLAALLFTSNFSTNDMVTNISGRGLGMAIIRDKIEALGGSLQMISKTGVGTTFKILLPLTLATYRGIFFRVGSHTFALPATFVEMVHRFSSNEVNPVDGKPSIVILDEPVPLYSLKGMLGIPDEINKGDKKFRFAIILSSGEQKLAFEVDEVTAEDEILVKNLGPQISKLKYYAGATITGEGVIVPILNAPDLIKATLQSTAATPAEIEPGKASRSILIVEDSITTRTLLKNILQTAGYEVEVAVDGVEALEKLPGKKFDLIVSDIEMPRMNGLELTKRIRSDKKYQEIPVILVTSLNKPEEKEQGLEVGANAYLTKQTFQQSGFISIINQFIG
ncbi:MAG: response regulator [Calditrichia bacterium]